MSVEVSPAAVRFDSPRPATDSQIERLAQDVRRELLNRPGLQFSSLVVRRVQNGVCLEGVLEANKANEDVCGLARSVAGVDRVLNHLVVRRTANV
jgi:osmotically-inducible protein OsmY